MSCLSNGVKAEKLNKMIKIYQVFTNKNLNIREIECSKATEKSYWTMSGQRNALNTNYVRSFFDMPSAVSYLESLLNKEIKHGEWLVKHYNEQLLKLNDMYKNS